MGKLGHLLRLGGSARFVLPSQGRLCGALRYWAQVGCGLRRGRGYFPGLWAPRRLRFELVQCDVFLVLDARWLVRFDGLNEIGA